VQTGRDACEQAVAHTGSAVVGQPTRCANAPDLTEPIVGFRKWRIHDGPSLWSEFANSVWQPGVMRARCLQDQDHFPHTPRSAPTQAHTGDAPQPYCRCGIYAWLTLPVMWCQPAYSEPATVIGAVRAWGRIELHEEGLRAQFVTPACFALPPGCEKRLRRDVALVARNFGVKVVSVSELEELAEDPAVQTPTPLAPTA
jgi:hypothetical protein